MRTIEQLLAYLNTLDVKLWADGDRLRYKAAKGTLTPALLVELSERKVEILEFLRTANNATHATAQPLQPIARDGGLPLSFAQQRLWFLNQLEPDSSAYNIPAAFRLAGELNITALTQSLGEIIRRHEALRTTFVEIDGHPFQVIAPVEPLNLPLIDLQNLPEGERRGSEVRRLVNAEIQQPFDLAQGPLLRVVLLRLDKLDHVLLLTMHHIVSDGWSMGVFIQELEALYNAFFAEQPSPLPELPIQYVDFAHWQRQWMQGEVLESQLAYWKKQLGGNLPILELPTDRPWPATQTFRGDIQSLILPEELSASLDALSREENVTLFMTLLAAFKVLLYRYTGQTDLIVGSPIAGRGRVETEGLVGFFVNSLVLRTDLSGNPGFRELLGQVREVALGGYAHQDIPFEKIVEELQPERDPSRSPLFQVMFVLQNVPIMSSIKLPNLNLTPFADINTKTSMFDLSLTMIQTEQGLQGVFEYNTDIFEATTIARLAEHFQNLLTGIVANPEQRLLDLPILSESEKHKVLVEWNSTQQDYPKDQCIHNLFETQAEQTPNAVALTFQNTQLTYQELNRRANQLGHYLQRLGVKKEALIGICMARSPEMIIALLGILKAGGAYVPLDPAYPQERLDFILTDSKAPVLITESRLANRFKEYTGQVVCMDDDVDKIVQESGIKPVTDVTPDNPVYIIYTSGSTGQPKGVMTLHRGLVNYAKTIGALFGLETNDRLLQFASISFDVSAEEIFTTLTRGATLVLRTETMPGSIETFLQACQAWHITVLDLPTAYWHELTAQLYSQQLKLPPEIRLVVVGGEQMQAAQLSRWQHCVEPNVRLLNGYGPTEATIAATFWEAPATTTETTIWNDVPIGRPIANYQIYILDQSLQPVPIGVPGELHIGGVGLARGYLNRPELTEEKFIINPFDVETHLYKTGDLARYTPDGNIEFLGRIDHQVKIRGFRIELGEIQAVLGQHPVIKEAIVLAPEDKFGTKQLVGYVVPKQPQAVSAGELRSFLKQKLPEYMCPSAFVFLDTLPITANGKVNHRALPVPDNNRSELEDAFVPPRTATEERLASIWVEILKTERVGIYDSFFDLGGHSLLAIQLISRIRSQFDVDLPLPNLFESPTVAHLAELIARQKAEQADNDKLMQLLAELDELSPDEVEAQLRYQ